MTHSPPEENRRQSPPFDDEDRWPPRAILVVLSIAGLIFAGAALARYATFHNETFDLAFYTRMAWGLVGASFWDPIIGAHVFGLHISPILVPLAILGRLFGTAETLLLAQGAAAAAAAWPLGRMARRRLGSKAMWWVVLGFLAYPNLFPVASGEFHPGTLALLPLAWALDATDRGSTRGLVFAVICTLLCREDLALVTACIALLFGHLHPDERPFARRVCAASLAYAGLFFLVIHPLYAPAEGSLEAHFGAWGSSLSDVAIHVVTHPLEVLTHVLAAHRVHYLAGILIPLAALPLLAPRWLAVTAPVLAVNLLSHFPAASRIEDHYLSPAVPLLFAAAIQGYARMREKLRARHPRSVRWLPPIVLMIGFAGAAGSHLGVTSLRPFLPDSRTEWAEEVVAEVRPEEQVQAPDELLPHLAERHLLHRAPPPDRGADVVILSIAYRADFVGDESLIRTIEEPVVRSWLAKEGFGLVLANPAYLLFRRGADPRAGPASRFFLGEAPAEGQRIAACLDVLRVERLEPASSAGGRVRIEFGARGSCPHDLVLRLGRGHRPTRVELLFDGVLSPARLRSGDRVVSEHSLPSDFTGDTLRVGALRSSGARPEHADPVAVSLPLAEVGERPGD